MCHAFSPPVYIPKDCMTPVCAPLLQWPVPDDMSDEEAAQVHYKLYRLCVASILQDLLSHAAPLPHCTSV